MSDMALLASVAFTSAFLFYLSTLPPSQSNAETVQQVFNTSIPKRIFYAYKWNILKRKFPVTLYDNVKKSQLMFSALWGTKIADVEFLDIANCKKKIYRSYPTLLPFYEEEPNIRLKLEMCKLSALYLDGGYFVDVRLDVITPPRLDSSVSFSAAQHPNRPLLMPYCLASKPNTWILYSELERILQQYENLQDINKGLQTNFIDNTSNIFQSKFLKNRCSLVIHDHSRHPLFYWNDPIESHC